MMQSAKGRNGAELTVTVERRRHSSGRPWGPGEERRSHAMSSRRNSPSRSVRMFLRAVIAERQQRLPELDVAERATLLSSASDHGLLVHLNSLPMIAEAPDD